MTTAAASPSLERRKPAVSSPVFGMLVFVVTEAMFFSGLVSAFLVNRTNSFGNWAPPGNITLPQLATAFNTAVLMASGILMVLACIKHPKDAEKSKALYFQSTLLGAFFVAFQGWEWIKLIEWGMTINSGIFGATFFLLIGSHGFHAALAILAMVWHGRAMQRGTMTTEGLKALAVFWLFIVGVWPILYGLVYFS